MGFIRKSLEFLTDASNRGAKKPEDFIALALMDAGAKAIGRGKYGPLPTGEKPAREGIAKRAKRLSQRVKEKRKKRAKKRTERKKGRKRNDE